MNKLLETYIAKPTLANAQRIRAHSRKHPFSTCLLSDANQDVLANAIHHANSGKLPE
jgi:hypothetical protein